MSDFKESFTFSTVLRMSNFINILSVGAEIFHAGRWTDGLTGGRIEGRKDKWTDRVTDTTKLIIASRNFANTRKKKRKEGGHQKTSERRK